MGTKYLSPLEWELQDLECTSTCQSCSHTSLLATVEEAIALDANIMPSKVASAQKALAFSILEAPSRSLDSGSGSNSSIFLPHTIDAFDTMEAVVHALMAKAVVL